MILEPECELDYSAMASLTLSDFARTGDCRVTLHPLLTASVSLRVYGLCTMSPQGSMGIGVRIMPHATGRKDDKRQMTVGTARKGTFVVLFTTSRIL